MNPTIKIIYAEKDNTLKSSTKGWVSSFQKFLGMMLYQTTGINHQIEMISDESDSFDVDNTQILIPILSPDFILSGQCLDRLEAFVQKYPQQYTHYLFKIYKTPLDFVDIPQNVRDLHGYNLFLTDQYGQAKEVEYFFSPEAEKSYWMKMVDLCYDINELVLVLSAQLSDKKKKETSVRKKVYLAETGYDLSSARNIVKRELIQHGFEVLPKNVLPSTLKELRKSIEEDLKQCDFSIHMMGSSYGNILPGTKDSVVDVQNEMAALRVQDEKAGDFHRLIWISPDLKHASERQKAFIHTIKRDANVSLGAEILQTSLEDFKNTLWNELMESNGLVDFNSLLSASSEGKPAVYCIFDQIDQKNVAPLLHSIAEKPFNLLFPSFKGDLLALRNEHVSFLKEMDAAIVYQKEVNEQWVHMKLLDLLKAPGLGRNKPLIGKLMVVAEEVHVNKELFERYDIEIINQNDKKAIDHFLQEVKNTFEKKAAVV